MITHRLPRVCLLAAVLAAFTVLSVRADIPKPATPTKPVPIALYAGPGVSGTGPKLLEERFQQKGEFAVTPITPEEIRAGKLKDFQVLIVPGGKSRSQGDALGEDGRERVRQFIAEGAPTSASAPAATWRPATTPGRSRSSL